MMLEELRSVYRYADHPVVTATYANSVHDHTRNVEDCATQVIARTVTDPGLCDAITQATVKPIRVHDFGEVVAEPTTSKGETDPELQQQLIAARPTDFEEEVAVFFFQAAAFYAAQGCPDEFHQFVRDVRRESGVQDNGFGLPQKTAENLLAFYQTVRNRMHPEQFDKTLRLKNWNKSSIVKDVETMKYFYNNIEGQNFVPDFPGSFGKTIEKWEGTHYTLSVHNQKKNSGIYDGTLLHQCPPEEQCRVNGRYETMLAKLHDQASTNSDPVLRTAFSAMSRDMTRVAYQTSRDIYAAGPTKVLYKNKLIETARIVDHYDVLLNQSEIVPRPGLVVDAFLI